MALGDNPATTFYYSCCIIWMNAPSNSLYISCWGGEDHLTSKINRTLKWKPSRISSIYTAEVEKTHSVWNSYVGKFLYFCITYLVTMFIYMCKAAINMHLFILFIYIVRHCWMQNFLSNPRWTHSGKEDEEKEEWGLLWAVICPTPALLLPPPPPSHTARLSHRLRPRYQD